MSNRRQLTSVIRTMSKNYINIIHLKTFQTFFRAFNDTAKLSINKKKTDERNNHALFPTQPRIIWASISNPPKYFGSDNQVCTAESELLNNTSTIKSPGQRRRNSEIDSESSHLLL